MLGLRDIREAGREDSRHTWLAIIGEWRLVTGPAGEASQSDDGLGEIT